MVIESTGRVGDPLGPEVQRSVRLSGTWRPCGGGVEIRDEVWEPVVGALDLQPRIRPSSAHVGEPQSPLRGGD
ncbi:MAG: hypothetical protein ACE5O2_05445 [Armatimonadota bacterium]